ncbi:GIY-YIG nuclease family protein [Patescibacteria group bacterium]|nr:MAG: GIY-YIG nuclease family protein [Patescibacteria group bacterium]
MEGFYVYILQSLKSGMYYIGSSNNPENRLIEHNNGETPSTKNKGPWIIKFKQHYETTTEARRIELKLKRLKRRDYIEKIINDKLIKTK